MVTNGKEGLQKRDKETKRQRKSKKKKKKKVWRVIWGFIIILELPPVFK